MKYLYRLLMVFITMILVTFLTFAAFAIIPGDAASSALGTMATEEKVEELREDMGLNRPLIVRYGEWVYGILNGRYGISYSYNMDVSKLVGNKLPITIMLTLMSTVIVTIISLPIGIYASMNEGSVIDVILISTNQIIMSIPSFFQGLIITLIFGLGLKFFTPGRFISYEKDVYEFLIFLIAPAIAIALPKVAMAVKILRGACISQARLDYVRTAYSKGSRKCDVFYRHILRNALIPYITFMGMAMSDMLVGSIIIEQVFGIPGLGRLLITSISNRDYPVVQFIILFLGMSVIILNSGVDGLIKRIDPRIR